MYYRYYDKKDNRLKNYYKLLGISRDSVESTIHEHYQSLYQNGKSTELIDEAYAVLSNPEERERYNRVYDRYNWDYGLQKNSLYEKAKPKNHGRLLFLILLFVLMGFLAIAFFFFRSPEATMPPAAIEEPAQPQAQTAVAEPNSSSESEQAEPTDQAESASETSPEDSETDSPASSDSDPSPVVLSVSDEVLAKYPAMEVYASLDNLYPKAQVTAGVNFRNEPGMDSTVLSSLGTDETFLVLGKVGGWSYIYRETQGYGWIGGKYIQFIE